ncbi:NUDIX hydrolase domain-like protein [Penicillium soppii]|jgi:ADP-ribose pyrophosphatase YjhB (NUDIX family)|uniref:NUDIX hydrolase domain-like protein n=1 Tax=Penicillium soppii TaxID=69789 RepID=UPI0025481BF6|nr:NUDIX hydrolase domain-like protein [Penicillium soppii]KAJ5856224.1 NUDIX hydrolase domain-like protein [Penicillium soppii]
MDPEQDLLASTLREIIPSPGRLYVGAAIFRIWAGGTLSILLMRRAQGQPDAELWEIPAGEVMESDRNVEEAIRRIVREQTQLTVFRVEDELSAIQISPTNERPLVIQLNFRVLVNERLSDRVLADWNDINYSDLVWARQDHAYEYDLRRELAMLNVIDEAYDACSDDL